MCNSRMQLMCKTKCRNCLLRFHCDAPTEYICKTNDFCKFIKDNGNHGHWEAHYVCSNCGRIEKVQFSECPCCHANMDGFDQYISEEGTKLKKWYTVRFSAKLDEDDIPPADGLRQDLWNRKNGTSRGQSNSWQQICPLSQPNRLPQLLPVGWWGRRRSSASVASFHWL